MSEIDLTKLAAPFPAEDIEWRVAQSGLTESGGIYCRVFAYVTVRAIEERLDEVCGIGNWKNEQPQVHQFTFTKKREGDDDGPEKTKTVAAFVSGISIRIDGEWITKWDVSEPTGIEPAKGGFSGAMKRAGSQWGIFRYGYYLEEGFADVSATGGKGWNYARLPKKFGSKVYYWKPPQLPGWALPKESDMRVTSKELADLKREWRKKFAADVTDPEGLREGFTRFVFSIVGEFPVADVNCWSQGILETCLKRIAATTEAHGVSADVPFDK